MQVYEIFGLGILRQSNIPPSLSKSIRILGRIKIPSTWVAPGVPTKPMACTLKLVGYPLELVGYPVKLVEYPLKLVEYPPKLVEYPPKLVE